MKFFKFKIFLLFLVIIALLVPFPALAQDNSRTNALNEIVGALNKETEEVFYVYSEIVNEFENGDEKTLLKFKNKLPDWNSILIETNSVYKKYKDSKDPQISEISSRAIEANNKALASIELYVMALTNSGSETENSNNIDKADTLFVEASETHFKTVDLYNDYSGYSSSVSIKNWLIFFSIISGLFSLLLFFKAKNKSQLEAEIIRSKIYKSLFSSSIWMTMGIVVTTAGYAYSLKEGGTYYILYGPVLFGGWQLLKGLYVYFTSGQKSLNYLNSIQKNEAIKESYTLPKQDKETPEYVCKYCGSKQAKKGIICNNCGENQL